MVTYQSLADVDIPAVVIGHLAGHSAVTAALGGTGRVGGENVPPYPRVIVGDPPGGDDRGLVWLTSTLITVEALGDVDGAPGKAALARILRVVLLALGELPTLATVPGRPVITRVASDGGGGWSPYPTGQPRYVATRQIWAHPGLAA